jgi:hypothetical protein
MPIKPRPPVTITFFIYYILSEIYYILTIFLSNSLFNNSFLNEII